METAEADRLRDALTDALKAGGSVRTERVEAALRAVPRHLFIQGTPLNVAYANEVVLTKRAEDLTPISSASQPSIVARMLEQLEVAPGDSVLEIGAGTGYNAALLAQLAGASGQVTTIDVDEDLTTGARESLREAGFGRVRVVLGDGGLGCPHYAPYHRVIATVGAWDLPLAWLGQLAPTGRLVVPLRLRGSVTRSIAFERDGTAPDLPRWRSVSSEMCSFMPLRGGVADDPARSVPLTADGSITLAAHQDQEIDAAALADVISRPRAREWTGITLGEESPEWLFLWLACTLRNAVSRMNAHRQAIDEGLVECMPSWGTVATAEAASLAYIAFRSAAGRREVGVIGHGPRGDVLARAVAAQVRAWNRRYRSATARFSIQPVTTMGPPTSDFAFRTPHCWLSIAWE
ncbi:MAG TPA: methyltransferase, FxLD system [Trebonia sp.]|nr:methyltransferase, FxLD system [Trebonia sp.]